MTLSSYNPHTRYKERWFQRLSRFLGFLAIMLLSSLFGFWLGKQYGAERLITLEDQIIALEQQRNLLQDSVTDLRAEAKTANMRHQQIREELNELVPEGPMQDLTRLLKEQLDEGLNPERLAFIIRSASPPSDCTDADTKRFVVSTPAYKGPESVVSVADGAVQIYGSGTSMMNSDGQPEAWYDPSKSISVTFKTGEKTETKKGVLPIKYSVVANGREYRFTIEEGSKSFARIIFDSCAYP